jgi:hypothetical protein
MVMMIVMMMVMMIVMMMVMMLEIELLQLISTMSMRIGIVMLIVMRRRRMMIMTMVMDYMRMGAYWWICCDECLLSTIK